MVSVGWTHVHPGLFGPDRLRRAERQTVTKFDVGVRALSGTLVGFGSLSYRRQNGELGDFVVAETERGRGIGKAIINIRLRQAESKGVTSLYMPYLEPTNTLRSYYLENGFQVLTNGKAIGRGPKPMSLTAALYQDLI
jgi:GNAT superfamily N-acetyltransferase